MDSDTVKFTPYSGYLQGLYVDDNHLVFRWNGPGKILFSVSRRGDAASCHFASDKKGLRHLKQAIDDFVLFVFWLFDWCTMVIAQVIPASVGRLIEKVGFTPFSEIDGYTIYMRQRDERSC